MTLKEFYSNHGIVAPNKLLPREELLYQQLSEDINLIAENNAKLMIQNSDLLKFVESFKIGNYITIGIFFGAALGTVLGIFLLLTNVYNSELESQLKEAHKEINTLHNNSEIVRENDRLRAEISKRDSKTCWGVLK